MDILWLSKYSKLLVVVSGLDAPPKTNDTRPNIATIANMTFFAVRFVADKCNPI
jgi:hypothetical protein